MTGFRASRTRSLLLVLLLLLQGAGLSLLGCREEKSRPIMSGQAIFGSAAPGVAQQGLGKPLFVAIRMFLSGSPNGKQQVAAFEARKADFIRAVDRIVPPSQAPNALAVFPVIVRLVRDGTLPRMTDALGRVVKMALDEKNQTTLKTIWAMIQHPDLVADPKTATQFLSRFLQFPQLDPFVESLATVVAENDGLNTAGQPDPNETDRITPFLELITRNLRKAGTSSSHRLKDLVSTLLKSCTLRGRPNLGGPAWVVRLDSRGLPKVAVDPATGTLHPPFVDQNGDGLADLNPAGEPIDAQGQPIVIPAFASTLSGAVSRDAEDRALTTGGALLYEYVDVKRTRLGALLLILGELFEKDVPSDIFLGLNAVVNRSTHDNGTSDPSDDYTTIDTTGLVGDVIWSKLEISKYRQTARFLNALSASLRHDRQKTEAILINLARALRAARNVKLPPMPKKGPGLFDALVPLFDEVFELQGNGVPASRVLIRTLAQKISTVKGIPQGMANMLRFHDVVNGTPTGPGNPSALSRLLNLMVLTSKCPKNPILGDMGEFFLKTMAGTQKVLGIPISVKTITTLLKIGPLKKLLCKKVPPQEYQILESYARSGMLDAMAPIALGFDRANQIPLLKKIYLAIGTHYPTAIQPLEKRNIAVMQSGAVEPLFEAIAIIDRVLVPGTQTTAAEILADWLGTLFDDDRTVTGRNGATYPSLIHLSTRPSAALGDRAEKRGVGKNYGRAFGNLLDVLLATVPGQGGQPVLKNECMIDLALALLDWGARNAPTSASARAKRVKQNQADALQYLGSRELSAYLELADAYFHTPSRTLFRDATVSLLTARKSPRKDVFGGLCRLLGTFIQPHARPTRISKVLRFAGDALDPARGHLQPIVQGMVRIMTTTQGRFLLTIARNALDRGPSGNQPRPLDTLRSVFDDVQAAAGNAPGTAAPSTLAEFIDIVEGLHAELTDPGHVLQRVYRSL